ncbi:tyrosinase family protein [Massilia sp. S19_KUP03_FR1]|uniref:tyrosinase family protein n=1 Tax=Massilia sp. S19_KUP03_FR1 TaxID=3025503 RepID=UPI002FCD8D80
MAQVPIRTRRSILEIQTSFENKTDTKTLEDLMTAWAGIQAIAASDPTSFFVLAGYHGEPFRGAGYGSSAWWGGWCNHGNVLFPTWHRMYLMKVEAALQSIPGCEDVMLPYWDETDEYTLTHGIPSCLTDEVFTYSNGKQIPNPLRAYTFQVNITDNVSTDQEGGAGGLYSKNAGYSTVRYPYSGLVGTSADREATLVHNAQWNQSEATAVLNQNVVNWLNLPVVIQPDNVNPSPSITVGINSMFHSCLNAPNYTVFSNTTSAQNYNDCNVAGAVPVVPLEQPHNDIHVALGGVDITTVSAQNVDLSPIVGANGDMGENDTASFDPIFYFHHANVDRIFWVWQKKTGNLDALDIIPQYPGTNSVDSQGPTPGVSGNVWLSMESPLMPFMDATGKVVVSNDVVNIEKQLNYTYTIGSLDRADWSEVAGAPAQEMLDGSNGDSGQVLTVSGANKAAISGSFVIAGYATVNGQKILVGVQSVLSRNAIQGCANCQTHLNVKAHFSLNHFAQSEVSAPGTIFSAEIIGHRPDPGVNRFALASTAAPLRKALKVSVK